MRSIEPAMQNGHSHAGMDHPFADSCAQLLERTLTCTGALCAKLSLVQGETMLLHATAGRVPPEAEGGAALETNLARVCARTGCFLRSDVTEIDPRVDAAACRVLGVRSMVVLPVQTPERVLAVLALFASARGAFSLPQIGMLQNITARLTEVLEHSTEVSRTAKVRPASLPAPAMPIAPPPLAPATASLPKPLPVKTPVSGKVLRFMRSERLLHWSIAIPFTVCFVTALVLVVLYNPHPQRPWRLLFSWVHRLSGLCLAVLPLITLLTHHREHKTHLHNIREGWIWVRDDFKWLLLMGPAAISSRIVLPEQGKFNAAEKLNFMMVMTSFPLFITTGIWLFLPGLHFLPWVAHVAMALLATPLMLGHIFMATVNPSTRVGLEGMFSGYVDRQWAEHHYRRWYRERFRHAQRDPSQSHH